MGIERVPLTAKVDIENMIWIEGLRSNVFLGVSRSGILNLLLTWLRLAHAAGDITLSHESVKKHLVPNVHPVYASRTALVKERVA